MIKIHRPLAFFDLETTGTKVATDRIVEISVLKIFPGGDKESITRRINPGIPNKRPRSKAPDTAARPPAVPAKLCLKTLFI